MGCLLIVVIFLTKGLSAEVFEKGVTWIGHGGEREGSGEQREGYQAGNSQILKYQWSKDLLEVIPIHKWGRMATRRGPRMVIEMEKIGDSKDRKDLLTGCVWDKAEGRVHVSCLGNRTNGEDWKRLVQNRNSILDALSLNWQLTHDHSSFPPYSCFHRNAPKWKEIWFIQRQKQTFQVQDRQTRSHQGFWRGCSPGRIKILLMGDLRSQDLSSTLTPPYHRPLLHTI